MIDQLKDQMNRAAEIAADHPQLQYCTDARDLFMGIIAIELAKQEGRVSSEDCPNTSLGNLTEYERRKAALPIMESTAYEKAVKKIADELQI